jgi:hypothetical protein
MPKPEPKTSNPEPKVLKALTKELRIEPEKPNTNINKLFVKKNFDKSIKRLPRVQKNIIHT